MKASKKRAVSDKLTWRQSFKQYWLLYLMLLVPVAYYVVFKYLPMVGITIAFKNYKPFDGIKGIFSSPWVGLKWFEKFFKSKYAYRIIRNSFVISFKKLIVCFPASILLAVMLNGVNNLRFKKTIQTVSYLPHFLSAVVVCSIVRSITSVDGGIVNAIVKAFGGKPIVFVGDNKYFQPLLVVTDLWKGIGWNSIVYLAAMTNIDPSLHEAATVDGAEWYHRIWHVTLPAIAPIISMMFILRCGELLNAGFETIFNLYSSNVYETGDIIDTYVYREGLKNMNYSYSTAVNLFKSVLAMVMVLGSNWVSKKLGQEGIW